MLVKGATSCFGFILFSVLKYILSWFKGFVLPFPIDAILPLSYWYLTFNTYREVSGLLWENKISVVAADVVALMSWCRQLISSYDTNDAKWRCSFFLDGEFRQSATFQYSRVISNTDTGIYLHLFHIIQHLMVNKSQHLFTFNTIPGNPYDGIWY